MTRILIVDDEETIRLALRKFLRSRGYEVEIAGSGDIDGAAVIAETASVSIAGSGNVTAHATSTASVDIAGSGDVRVTGGAKCSVSKAGSGNVDCS